MSDTITIRTYVEENFVCIGVTDTATGMTEEVKSRVFEHFLLLKRWAVVQDRSCLLHIRSWWKNT